MTKPQQRMYFIDIARGLGILLVVLGHNYIIGHPKTDLFFLIFLFHMPLFYFLSGFVQKHQSDYIFYLKKRSKQLLLPYFSTSFFWMLALIIGSRITGEQFHIGYYIKTTLYSTGVNLSWNVLWFFTSLFSTQILFLVIEALILRKINNWVIRFSTMVIFLLVGIYIMRGLWQCKPPFVSSIGFFCNGTPGLPWSLDLVFITVFYYYLGSEMKNGFHESMDSTILFVVSSLVFFGLYFSFGYHLDLNVRVYDHCIINSLETISGILIIMYLSKKIDHKGNNFCRSVFCYLGRLSMVIFIFHRQFQDRSYRLLTTFAEIPMEMAGVLSFILGVAGPILLYEILIKRIALLRLCYPVANPAKITAN